MDEKDKKEQENPVLEGKAEDIIKDAFEKAYSEITEEKAETEEEPEEKEEIEAKEKETEEEVKEEEKEEEKVEEEQEEEYVEIDGEKIPKSKLKELIEKAKGAEEKFKEASEKLKEAEEKLRKVDELEIKSYLDAIEVIKKTLKEQEVDYDEFKNLTVEQIKALPEDKLPSEFKEDLLKIKELEQKAVRIKMERLKQYTDILIDTKPFLQKVLPQKDFIMNNIWMLSDYVAKKEGITDYVKALEKTAELLDEGFKKALHEALPSILSERAGEEEMWNLVRETFKDKIEELVKEEASKRVAEYKKKASEKGVRGEPSSAPKVKGEEKVIKVESPEDWDKALDEALASV